MVGFRGINEERAHLVVGWHVIYRRTTSTITFDICLVRLGALGYFGNINNRKYI